MEISPLQVGCSVCLANYGSVLRCISSFQKMKFWGVGCVPRAKPYFAFLISDCIVSGVTGSSSRKNAFEDLCGINLVCGKKDVAAHMAIIILIYQMYQSIVSSDDDSGGISLYAVCGKAYSMIGLVQQAILENMQHEKCEICECY